MKIIKEAKAMQEISEFLRLSGKKIGFVPTMGYLHSGHISLIKKAKEECDIVIVSIYVNPTQFLKDEDFETYPRDFDADYLSCKNENVDYIFNPDNIEMYKRNHMTNIMISNISNKLEGEIRPGHFIGVATVVLKLFNITKPHVSYFGQKDAQQCIVIKRLVEDLNVDIKIETCETIREDNGLAKSSRNVYLSENEKNNAAALFKSLSIGKSLVLQGINDPDSVILEMSKIIKEEIPNAEIQYISVTDNELLNNIDELNNYKGEVLISLAVKTEKTRLIDNVLFSKN
ncbi:MAG TPA: pantoate--beta-alanine ligase [Ignavibacteria bacterium]|nr:pantoate--beta-alanine ligase [Ignavibacteria bacterium]